MPFPVVRITQHAANYVRLIAWLLLSIFKPHKLKLISSIALAVLCLSGQAAAIFAIYWYARTMERTGAASLRVPSLDFALTDATSVLAQRPLSFLLADARLENRGGLLRSGRAVRRRCC